MVTRALPLYRPQCDLVRDCQAAGCDEFLVWLEGLGLEEAVRVVCVDPGNDRVAAGLGDAEKALQYRAEVEREYAAAVGMIECL